MHCVVPILSVFGMELLGLKILNDDAVWTCMINNPTCAECLFLGLDKHAIRADLIPVLGFDLYELDLNIVPTLYYETGLVQKCVKKCSCHIVVQNIDSTRINNGEVQSDR